MNVSTRPPFPERRPDPSLARSYAKAGLWTSAVLGDVLGSALATRPAGEAATDERGSWTYAELDASARRVAAGLAAMGVTAGDVVLWQVPNCREVLSLLIACWQLGAVAAPVVEVYREHELRQIIAAVAPTVVASVVEHRGFQHAELFDDLLHDVDLPAKKLLVDGERVGWTSWSELPDGGPGPGADVAPTSPSLLLFTSGTTAAPKVVVHTHRSLLAEARQVTTVMGWTADDVSYVATPLAHVSGLLRGVLAPLSAGGAVRTRQRWDPQLVVDDLGAGDVSILGVPGIGTRSALLGELLDVIERGGTPPRSVRLLVATGPRADLERAEALGLHPGQHYGMSELPTITVVNPSDPFDQRVDTAGRVAPGVDLRVVDGPGSIVPAGTHGEIEVRGPEQMSGYLSADDDRAAWTDDGWLRTGDIGAVDGAGYVSITGRTKDIINRGGEKFSALEIEEQLARHPAVSEAAVVPVEDRRLGEVPAAFVVLRDGRSASAADTELARHLVESGLARQKVPVRWEFVDHLPRTASGKVKKGELH